MWAKELAEDSVRANAIGVGSLETLFMTRLPSDSEMKKHIEKTVRAIQQGRFGKLEDIAVASFLASDEIGFVAGSEYGVDGGFSA